jgi:hypothetical protein
VQLNPKEEVMSAVLLAVFTDYQMAERVRIYLVQDGFPTDRVELTACCEPGRAGLEPADSLHGKLAQYFRTLFGRADEHLYAERLAECVEGGAATITVHPRGAIEAARATAIFADAGPVEVAQHDPEDQMLEHAAARHSKPWISNLWVDVPYEPNEPHCIYCRLFERNSH